MSTAVASTPVLSAERLHRFFHTGDEEVVALRDVSITVGRGEIVAVTGPSGSGKSTLLACVAGLDEPDGGTVRLDGVRLSRRPEVQRARMRAGRIGMLFQSANLVEHLDLRGNLAVAAGLAGRGRHPDTAAVLGRVGLAARAGHRPSQLSGGELARAGLAVALVNDPPLLLADEPTGELDSVTEGVVVDLLAAEAHGGRAVLVVTHSAAVAAAADRVVALADGAVVA